MSALILSKSNLITSENFIGNSIRPHKYQPSSSKIASCIQLLVHLPIIRKFFWQQYTYQDANSFCNLLARLLVTYCDDQVSQDLP